MATTLIAIPGTKTTICGANGVTYTAINGIVQVTNQADINALIAIGGNAITLPGIPEIIENLQTGLTYCATLTDRGKLVLFNNAAPKSMTIPVFPPGYYCLVGNIGAGTLTVTPRSGTIGGAANLLMPQFDCALLISSGAKYRKLKLTEIN